eukprot:3458270-Prymnesium_polylepis.1
MCRVTVGVNERVRSGRLPSDQDSRLRTRELYLHGSCGRDTGHSIAQSTRARRSFPVGKRYDW